MNWINRYIVPTSSVVAAAAMWALAGAAPARADAPIVATYENQSIRFTHVASLPEGVAIGVNDPGFQALLHASGAILTWKPGERYVLITTAVPSVVSFAIGDRRYDVGPIALQAAFAPYQRGDEAFLPLDETLSALDLALRADGRAQVLQPLLAGIDLRQDGDRVTLLAHAGAPVSARVVRQTSEAVTYAFDGVGTELAGTRQVGLQGVKTVEIARSGSVRSPTTLVTVEMTPGTTVQAPRSNGDRDVVLEFVSPQLAAAPSPTPVQPPQGPAQEAQAAPGGGPAVVTGVTVQPSGGGVSVAIAVNGSAQYEWHRLRQPDNRVWIDVHNAQLQGPPIDQSEPPPVLSMRVRQIDPQTVRVALSLNGPKAIAFSSSPAGLGIAVGSDDAQDDLRAGSGTLGVAVASGEDNAAATPAPLEDASADNPDAGWKFGPHSSYVPANPRLIVIDPGHGGSDRGTIHGGVAEADLTLDMAKRLRDILVSRGWQVKMTRDTDVDVYAPDDSAHQELQARVDVANDAGARLFVSIHVNAFINAGPYGTTLYVSKADDVALARQVETQVAGDGTKDDGIVKSHLYVTLHTRMPAVLIETAFLSNPSDYALLTSPAWRQKVAQEIADGIGRYSQQYPVPNQPPQ